jgi:hypothetical protein
VVVKHFPNSFFETKLLGLIEKLEVTELVVCGMMTHMCIDTTVRAAKDHRIPVTLLKDACATKDLTFNGQTVPAGQVQAAYLAGLAGMFAQLSTADEIRLRPRANDAPSGTIKTQGAERTEAMRAKIQEVTFDCADAAKLAEFWGNLLESPWGYRPQPGGVVDAGDMWLLFQAVPEPKSSPKNRLHLDIEVDNIRLAAIRAEKLGATRAGEFHDDPAGGGFVVMQDPEANEFCLVAQPEGSWTALLNAIVAERGE